LNASKAGGGEISILGASSMVTEDQLLQMYYSSAGAVNQTAQFNNFNTLEGVQSN
jgi:hypothetical protein